MTTRHEAELREIESMISRPKKGQQVTAGMLEHVRVQRERERARDQRTKELGGVIQCEWPEGEPKKWEDAVARVVIGGEPMVYMVEPYKEIEGKQKLRTDILTLGYKGIVEAWALWRWHIARGSEVDDTDRFIVDCDLPTFEWSSAEPVVKPKAKAGVANA